MYFLEECNRAVKSKIITSRNNKQETYNIEIYYITIHPLLDEYPVR